MESGTYSAAVAGINSKSKTRGNKIFINITKVEEKKEGGWRRR